jgi:hypothetical protein
VSQELCGSEPLGGGRCELPAGHEGKHRKAVWKSNYWDQAKTREFSYWFEWSDQSQHDLAQKWSSGRD